MRRILIQEKGLLDEIPFLTVDLMEDRESLLQLLTKMMMINTTMICFSDDDDGCEIFGILPPIECKAHTRFGDVREL